MKSLDERKERYLRDPLPVRLGGIASNLARIAWFAEREARNDAIPVFRESKYFTEWAAPACALNIQSILADLQIELACWERAWGKQLKGSEVAAVALNQSDQIVRLAGLLG